jgi:hypothetical protein
MLSCLLHFSENVLHTSDGESGLDCAKVTLETLSELEQSNFRTIVSLAGAIRDAASFAWSSSRAGGAELEEHCEALRQIEIESGFVRASALGSIEAFSDNWSTSVCLAPRTDRIDIVSEWIQEKDSRVSPLSKPRVCVDAATNLGKSIRSLCLRIKAREQSRESVLEPEDSSKAGVTFSCQSARKRSSFERMPGLKVFCLLSAGLHVAIRRNTSRNWNHIAGS